MARKPKPKQPDWLAVDWPRLVTAVRSATSNEQAVSRLREQLDFAVAYKQIEVEAEVEKRFRKVRFDPLAVERVEAMATAMAAARGSTSVRRYYKIAAALDAAIHARRCFET